MAKKKSEAAADVVVAPTAPIVEPAAAPSDEADMAMDPATAAAIVREALAEHMAEPPTMGPETEVAVVPEEDARRQWPSDLPPSTINAHDFLTTGKTSPPDAIYDGKIIVDDAPLVRTPVNLNAQRDAVDLFSEVQRLETRVTHLKAALIQNPAGSASVSTALRETAAKLNVAREQHEKRTLRGACAVVLDGDLDFDTLGQLIADGPVVVLDASEMYTKLGNEVNAVIGHTRVFGTNASLRLNESLGGLCKEHGIRPALRVAMSDRFVADSERVSDHIRTVVEKEIGHTLNVAELKKALLVQAESNGFVWGFVPVVIQNASEDLARQIAPTTRVLPLSATAEDILGVLSQMMPQ